MARMFTIDDFIRERIKLLVKSSPIPDTKISELIGYNKSYLSQIITGPRLPSFLGLEKLCDFFQITLSDFFNPEFDCIHDVSTSYLAMCLSRPEMSFLLDLIKNKQQLHAIQNLLEAYHKN